MNNEGEVRQDIWDAYIKDGGMEHRTVKHMFVDYSRYHEGRLINNWFIDNKIARDGLEVLDYGCGVGDYGMYLLRRSKINVTFYDFPRSSEFVDYRLKRESLEDRGYAMSADSFKFSNYRKFDLIIFGEVLEHLDDPAELLALVVSDRVKYIFTSSYPYRSEDPEDSYWSNHDHSDKARRLIPVCKRLLEDNYNYTKFDGELRLWTRK
jgi:2-polyprenyl-3-methyl-5-hydroxy-6-metoxy-1,4-benzoquinol methylase